MARETSVEVTCRAILIGYIAKCAGVRCSQIRTYFARGAVRAGVAGEAASRASEA